MRKISDLRWNRLNPRREDEERDDLALAELADSIRAKGVLQPFLVLPDGTIVAGHRRWLAAKLAGVDSVPVTVRNLSEADQLEAMLIENHQRKSLDPLQTALTCKALLDRGRSLEAIAKQTGMGMQTASKYLQLLDMPERVQRAVGNYDLPLAAVAHLAKLRKRPADLEVISSRAITEGWLTSEVEMRVRDALGRPAVPTRQAAEAGRCATGSGTLATEKQRGRPPGEVRPPADSPATVVKLIEDLQFWLRRRPEFVGEVVVRRSLKELADTVREAQVRTGE